VIGFLKEYFATWKAERQAIAQYEINRRINQETAAMETAPPRTLVALCVGHSRKTDDRMDGGAVTHDGATNEWHYNKRLAGGIAAVLAKSGVRSVIISEYEGSSYGRAQAWLAGHLKDLGCTIALELHFNSADSAEASGHEWLYWHGSDRGAKLAESLSAEMAMTGMFRTRGAKAIDGSDRGALFTKLPSCPSVICEPFFGSSFLDWPKADREISRVATAMAEGVLSYFD
jgi:N-acetylmuramoyl-L-alanine amidase